MRLTGFARLVIVSLLALIITASAAQAESAEQKQLRQALTTFLDNQQEFLAAEDNVRLKRDGTITIEPQEDYYVVTMPHLEIVHDNGKRVDLGILSINARPGDGNKLWHVSMALPTPMLVYNKKDLLMARLDIGKQRFRGTWHAGHQTFKNIDATYEDIVLKSHEQGSSLELSELNIQQALRDSSEKNWSGTGRFVASDASLHNTKGREIIKAGTAGLKLELDDYSPVRKGEFTRQWRKLTTAAQTPDKQKKRTGLKFYDLVTRKMLQIQNSANVTTFVKNLEIAPQNAATSRNAAEDIRHMGLEKMQYSFGFSDIRKDKAGLHFGFEMQGLDIKPKPDIAKGLMPEAMRMHYALDDLPYDDLVAFGRKQLGGKGNTNTAASKAMKVMPKMLSEAGTTFSMKDNYIHAGDYKANINATLKADASAAMNFTLDAKANIQGLQGLIEELKTRSKKADNPMIAGNMKKAVGMLTTVHMLGQQGEKGKDSRVYNIMVNKSGEAKLNGSNLSNIMQAFTGNNGKSSENATPPGLSGP